MIPTLWQFQRMKRIVWILSLLLLWSSAVAAPRPRLEGVEDERIQRLREGEVLSEGGYQKKEVWGRMEGMIPAPAEIVWRLFFQANDWKRYGLPSLADSRAVSEEVVQELGSSERVEDFYRAIGDLRLDPGALRKRGSTWMSCAFQFYDLPWPMADRWMILKTSFDETDSAKGIYKAVWTKAAGNVRTVDGTLVLRPFEGDRTKTLMSYDVRSDPGSHVPKFILKWGVRKTMPAVIRVIRREAEKMMAPKNHSDLAPFPIRRSSKTESSLLHRPDPLPPSGSRPLVATG